ncbi:MAG: PQQ-binding-like beta-propeller repeat protein [Firmicutes bacterium]|nr:PQQ-binding-like beta-propeller repeat protein [Bacillota bacterium]
MEAFVKNLASALKGFEAGEYRQALESITRVKELGRQLSVPAMGEVLLFEACLHGLVGETERADRDFEECIKNFSNSEITEHKARAILFYCRYLIKTGRLGDAEKRLAALWDIPCIAVDPFLSLFFRYCKAELRYFQIKAGRTVLSEKLMDELAQLYDSILLMECLSMAGQFQELGDDDSGEVLLELYYQTNKHDNTLLLMQKLKHRQMLRDFVAKGGKVTNADKITADRLDNAFGFLSAFIDGYLKLHFLIYPFVEEFRENYHLLDGEDAKYFARVKALFSEMGMIRTLPADFEAKINMAREETNNTEGAFKKEVENLSFINPVGIHFLPGFDIPVKLLQATLGDKIAAVEYYMGKKAIYCALISVSETVLYKIASNQDEISRVVEKLVKAASLAENAPKPSRKEISEIDLVLKEMFRILIKPLAMELAGKDKLYIIPHSYLYDVPFHALMDDKSTLADNFEICLIPDMVYLLKYANNSNIVLNRRRGQPNQNGEYVDITEIDAVALSRADEIVLMDRNFLKKPGDLGRVVSSYFMKGVGIVVGVLWDLPESARDDFFGTFLDNLISKSSVGAFESAKRQMMRKYGNNASYWAAYQLLGENLTVEPECLLARGGLDRGIKATKLISPSGKLLALPVIEDGILYSGGDDGNIIAINASDGAILWKHKTMDWVNNPFVIKDGVLYAGGMDKRVFAIDAVTGRKKWETKTGGWIVDTPAIGETRVFALCKDGYLYFIKKDTGEFEKRHFVGDINKAFLSLSGETLIAAVENRDRIKISCFDAKRYSLIWEKSVAGKLFGAARIYKGFFFHTYGKGLLCSENVFNGRIQWEYDLGSGILDLVFGDANLGYSTRDNIQISAVNLETGKTAWSVQTHATMVSKIALYNNTVYVLCSDDRIYTYDAGSGVEKKQIHIGKITGEKIVVHDDVIYLLNSSGGIYRITDYPDPVKAVENKDSDLPAQNLSVLAPVPLNCLNKIVVDKKTLQTFENTASQVWTKESDETILCEPVIIKGSALLLKAGNRMQLFDIKKSSPIWEATLQDVVNTPPVLHQGMLFCGGRSGYFYSIDSNNGKILAGQKIASNFCSAPAAGKASIFIGSTDKHLYSVSTFRGKVLWKFRTGGDIIAKPAVYKNTVIFTSGDGNVYCLETEFGDLVWQARTVSPQTWDPVIERDRVVIAGYDSYIYCFDPRNGKMFWKYHIADDEPSGKPLVTNDLVIVSTKKGGVYIIGLHRGNLMHTVQLNEPVHIHPVEGSGTEFALGTTKGSIIFLNKQDGHTTRSIHLDEPIFFPFVVGEKGMLVVQGNKSISLIQFPAKDAPHTEKIKTEKTDKPEESSEPATESETARLAASGNRPLTRDPNARFNQDGYKPQGREFGSSWMKDPRFRTGQGVPLVDDDDEYKPFKILMFIGFLLLNIILLIIKEYTLLYFSVPAFVLTGVFLIISTMQNQNRQMKNLFHRFVPSHLLEGFMNGGKTEEKVISVLFQDIYDYTPMSESITNEELYVLLQKIDAITDQVVTKHHGEIMSYIGDAYMITFNAVQNVNDHASRAVLTSMEIKREVDKLAKHVNINTNLPVPFKLKMGFGIHTGPALVGIRGAKSKLEPFVLGDTANIAARLQSLTRELGSDIIISETTKIQVSGAISTKSLGKSRLKGKSQPVEIFEVVGIKTASAAL